MPDPITSPQESAVTLTEIVDRMLDEVHRLPSELVTWKPAEDVWSVMEILCPVDEFVPFWTSETLRVVADPAYVWGRTHTDTDRLAAVNAARTRTLEDVTRSIHTGTADAAAKLRALTAADLSREAMSKNPRWGMKPAAFIVDDLVVHHVAKHLGQIRRNVSQYEARSRT
jgi:hypothetical protein